MHPFPTGTKLVTNDDYYEKFGRRVIGEALTVDGTPEGVTLMKWLHQEGNVIKAHQDQHVLMMTQDLEIYKPQ